MSKQNEIEKVPDKDMEIEHDSISIEYSDNKGSPKLDFLGTQEALLKTTGVRNKKSMMYILNKVISQLLVSKDTIQALNKDVIPTLSIMTELHPLDGFEGMLISQMLVTYEKAMDSFRKAENNKVAEIYFGLQDRGMKLMRLFNQQLEALDKHRRKGNQKMVVKHIHVNEGGQAIIGNVNRDGGVKDEKQK